MIKNLNSIGISTNDDVRNKLKTHQANIKKAYNKVKKNLNYTSLFMEHGPVNGKNITDNQFCGMEFISKAEKSGSNECTHSLITGDCNLKNNELVIKRYLDKLGYVLVPHHSGVKEWSDYICKNTSNVVWIVTISEIKSRPYGLIASDIYFSNEELYICDKEHEFEYEILFF